MWFLEQCLVIRSFRELGKCDGLDPCNNQGKGVFSQPWKRWWWSSLQEFICGPDNFGKLSPSLQPFLSWHISYRVPCANEYKREIYAKTISNMILSCCKLSDKNQEMCEQLVREYFNFRKFKEHLTCIVTWTIAICRQRMAEPQELSVRAVFMCHFTIQSKYQV